MVRRHAPSQITKILVEREPFGEAIQFTELLECAESVERGMESTVGLAVAGRGHHPNELPRFSARTALPFGLNHDLGRRRRPPKEDGGQCIKMLQIGYAVTE